MMVVELTAMTTAPFSALTCIEGGRKKEWRERRALDGVVAIRRS
jgi:hypothetical protein